MDEKIVRNAENTQTRKFIKITNSTGENAILLENLSYCTRGTLRFKLLLQKSQHIHI